MNCPGFPQAPRENPLLFGLQQLPLNWTTLYCQIVSESGKNNVQQYYTANLLWDHEGFFMPIQMLKLLTEVINSLTSSRLHLVCSVQDDIFKKRNKDKSGWRGRLNWALMGKAGLSDQSCQTDASCSDNTKDYLTSDFVVRWGGNVQDFIREAIE